MNQLLALHVHRFGTSVHLFNSPLTAAELSDDEQVAQSLPIDYEPDLEEERLLFMDIPQAGLPVFSPTQPELNDTDPIDALRRKYDTGENGQWGEHPDFPAADWRNKVVNEETRLGYWQWAANEIEMNELDGEEDDGQSPP